MVRFSLAGSMKVFALWVSPFSQKKKNNQACFCLSMESLAAPTFDYLELRQRGTFVPPQVWHRPSSLKPGAISAVHPGNIILLLLRENKSPHIINVNTNWDSSSSRSGRFTLSGYSFYTLRKMSSDSVLMCQWRRNPYFFPKIAAWTSISKRNL